MVTSKTTDPTELKEIRAGANKALEELYVQ